MANYLPPRRPYYRYPQGAPARHIPADDQHAPPSQRPRAPQQPPAPPQPDEAAAKTADLAAQVESLTGQVESLNARVAELESALEAARAEAGEQQGKAESYLDLAQRTQADFVNYKRRAERERADEAQAARADLLVQLLPALDDLERALSHVPESLRGNPWADGLPLVARQLRLALARAGVERLGAEGEAFDPRLHEAVAYQPQPGFAEGQIAHVARPGYRIGERIVRPAQVVVAQGGGQ
ncbi:MAG TPA: nucleotide exchange factor GrpE [Chloroflexota bacterium]|nr:nucleotide exchange factor GrpE [Chloroflexota bacterium]